VSTAGHRPSLIDLPALAERLGVTERHVRRLVAERRVPFIKWGHLLRFDPADIDAWLEEQRVNCPTEGVPSKCPSGLAVHSASRPPSSRRNG
jgi:excisionase family DNA binding protein